MIPCSFHFKYTAILDVVKWIVGNKLERFRLIAIRLRIVLKVVSSRFLRPEVDFQVSSMMEDLNQVHRSPSFHLQYIMVKAIVKEIFRFSHSEVRT